MKKFAKLYEYDSIGQVLATLSRGDDGPQIIVRIADINGIAPEITMSGYGDNDHGWNLAEEKLESVTEGEMLEIAQGIIKSIREMTSREKPQ